MPLDPHLLQLYLVAAVVLTLMPGPDSLLVMTRALAHGRRTALVATAGITLGNIIHATIAATGVAAVIATSPVLFEGFRTAGALYLTWLGLAALRAAWIAIQDRGSPAPIASAQPTAAHRVWLAALATNLLNPKVVLFHLSFVPQFVDPARGAIGMQTFLLGLILAGLGALYLGGIAVAGAAAAHRAYASTRVRAIIEGVAGLAFLAFAVRLLTTERRIA